MLVIAPHADDGEFGAGALISKCATQDADIYYAAFAAGTTNDSECLAATSVLGIPNKNVEVYEYKTREFSYSRQSILDKLIALKAAIRPSIVLVPSVRDTHQDHRVVAEECVRAFKDISVLAYELPWNDWDFKPRHYSTFDDLHLGLKLEAIAKYRSQEERYYANPDFIRSLAVVRGTQVKAKYAEAFEVIRWID